MAALPCKPLIPINKLCSAKPIRLILSDFDGTFTSNCSEVCRKNVEGFCLAKELGIHIGLATGRGRRSAVEGLGKEFSTEMNYDGYPGVFCNGALVFGLDGKVVKVHTLAPSFQSQIFDALKKRGLLEFAVGLTEGDSYCCEFNEWTLICYNAFHEAKPLLLDREGFCKHAYNKVMIWRPHEELLVLRKELEREMGDDLKCMMPYESLLELCESAVTKGSGLHALTASLGLSPEEVLVVGDSENDIPMFEEAGLAVAVANAQPQAKAAAMYEAVCAEDGPLLQIVRILQEKGLCPKQAEKQ